jgi:alkaline phosphatase
LNVLHLAIVVAALGLAGCGDGSDSDGLLLRSSSVAPGAVCANGGTLFEAGLDSNQNGILDSNEVSSAAVVCNGGAGASGATGATGPQGPAGPPGPPGQIIIIPGA